MGGQKFQYDESGGTFFYFLLSFLALILIPATFYYWPRKRKEDPDKLAQECQCPECLRKKHIMQTAEPYKGLKQFLTKFSIVMGWLILIFLAYKVSQFDYEMSNFDPYEILGVASGSSQADIKKAYRKLSLILHPDKETGDEKAFMKLTKAYQALTDDEARRNWEKYGSPDGPGAMSFGIALPSWIVEKENSVWVLGLYGLVFMIALPTAVGTWWYRSIKFSGDQVLLDTTQMYYYFFHKTPSMPLKRVIMILAASVEFDKRHNSEVTERQTDNEEVPALIKQLPNLNEKSKEMPLCRLYSIKARALLHAHLTRIKLNPNTLEKDRQFIIERSPHLIQEMVSCVNQLILLAYARRIQRLPTIETIENCMKLSPMIIQGLWEFKSPLLQLPYVTDDSLKYFTAKKRHIKTLQQFAQLTSDDRRAVLKSLTDFEFENVMKVLGQMPCIDFHVQSEVIDDENPTVVTAGAIVTVTVTLIRRDMRELFGDESEPEKITIKDEENVESAGGGDAPEEKDKDKEPAIKKPVWLKQTNKKTSGKKDKHKNKQQSSKPKPATKSGETTPLMANNKPDAGSKQNETPKDTPKVSKKEGKERLNTKTSVGDSDSDVSDIEDKEEKEDRSSEDEKKSSSVEDDDTEWEKFQQRLQKRDKVLEGRSKTSHSVHCPLYPDDKQEYWWTYICDRKSKTLLTAPYHVTALVDREEVQLKFTAPRWPGVYTFNVCLRSDSYLGMDQQQELKLDVQEAPEIPTEHPQWDLSESEDEQNVQDRESDFTTDDEAEDDD